jgi:TP901 family phage tail tape measure protein
MLSKLGQIESAEATKYLTSAMRGYKVEVDEVSRITDRLTAVDMEAAVSAGGIAEAMSMTANGARLAGVEMDKLIGILTAVAEVSQQDPSRVGTTFKTVFARMSNVKLGKLEDEDGTDITEELNNVETMLNRIGIPLRKNAMEWNNFGDVLDKLATKWSTLSSVEQSAIATALGGVRQKEAVLTLMENYDKVLQYESVALESSGTALQKFEDAYLGSIEAKTNRLKATFESLSMSIIGSGLVGGITDIVSGLMEFMDGTDKVIPTGARLTIVVILLTAALKRNATASVIASAKSIEMMISMVGLKQATLGTVSAMWAATKSMIAFLATNPVGWAILAVGAIASLGWAFDKMTLSQEEAREALKKSFDEFTDAENNLKSVNSNLSETKNRITELQNISNSGKITLVEQSELEQLKIANSELEKQIIQLRQIRDEAQKTTNKDAISLYNKGSASYAGYGKDGSEGWLKSNLKLLANDWIMGSNFEVMGQTQYIDYATESLKGLSSESEDFKNIQSTLTPIMEDYRSISEKLVPTNEAERKVLEEVNLQLDKMTYGLGNASDKAKIFELAISKYAGSNAGLISAANASDITAEKFNELASSDLKKYFEDVGISSDVAAKFLNALSNASSDVEASISKLQFSSEQLKSSLDKLSETESILSSISKEIEDSGNIGMGNITKMIEGYPELTDVLARYLAGVSSAKDVYLELERIYKQDYNSSVDLLAKKLDTDVEYYNKLINNGNEYLKKLADTYNINLKDFTNLANLKIAVETQMLNSLGSFWSQYYNAQTRQYTDYYTNLLNSVSSSYRGNDPILNEKLKQAFAVRDALNKLSEESYSPIRTSSIGAGNISNSFSTGGGSSKKEEDQNKLAFERQKAILDRQLALNLITEAQYINELENLYKKHFSDKSKYLAEYTQYEIEVYNKRQSFLEQAQKDLDSLHKATMDMIKKEKEEEKDALEKKKDGLKEYTDARKKALQDARDQDSYDKQIREKSTDIESIKAQLMGLSGDMSGAGMRKKTELTQSLKEAQDELSEAVADRQYEMQVEALDASYEAQEKNIDAQIEGIDSFLNNQNALVKASFDRMNGMSTTLKSQLIAYNKEYGDGIANDIVKNWDAATEALKKYGSAANVETTLGVITTNIGRASSRVPTGYANGTSGLKRDSIIVGTHELLLNKTGSNAYQMMNAGSPIFTEQQTKALKALLSSPNSLLTKTMGGVGLNSAATVMSMANSNNSQDIDLHYEFNISGTDPVGIESTIVKLLPKIKDYTLSAINKDVQFNKGVRLTAANMA